MCYLVYFLDDIKVGNIRKVLIVPYAAAVKVLIMWDNLLRDLVLS